MRLAIALLAAFVVAGCTTAVDAEAEAAAAAERRQHALGPDGDVKSVVGRILLQLQDQPMVLGLEADLYLDDAVRFAFDIEEIDTGDPQADRALEAVSVMIFCSADRIVLETTGLEALGEEDVDRETANDAGACLTTSSDDVDAMRLSISRLASGLEGMLSGVQQFANLGTDHEYVVQSATKDGADIQATYRIADQAAMEVDATIRDGKIVDERYTMGVAALGLQVTVDLQYAYGAREAAPEIRGAEQV